MRCIAKIEVLTRRVAWAPRVPDIFHNVGRTGANQFIGNAR
jgi:hypothetical protein